MKAPGVYKIQRVGTDQCYVGSSVNMQKRWQAHRLELKNGTHHAAYLQNAWAKYGALAFEFEVLEVCHATGDLKEVLAIREQHWIDALQPRFNTLKAAYSTLGFRHAPGSIAKMIGRTHTPETREKLRAAQTGVKRSPESVEKSRKAQIGRVKSTEETAKTVATRRANGGYSVTAEVREKISEKLKGKPLSPERVESLKGRVTSEETRKKLSAARTGMKATPEAIENCKKAWTPERRAAVSAQLKGRKMSAEELERRKNISQETREKLRQAALGKVRTEEAKAKMRKPKSPEHAANIRAVLAARNAKPVDEATREKMRASAKARWASANV